MMSLGTPTAHALCVSNEKGEHNEPSTRICVWGGANSRKGCFWLIQSSAFKFSTGASNFWGVHKGYRVIEPGLKLECMA